MKYDYLIVGAGLFGAVFANRAKELGKRCLVIDKRSHLGGNIYCEEKNGINIHKYGAHIFHTSDKEIWDFVNSFVEFNSFINSPLAQYGGKLYNLPFNMSTFYQMWGVMKPEEAKAKIEEQKKEAFELIRKRGHDMPMNLEEQALMLVGSDIYNTLIKGYTEKQWGRPCRELPAFIIKRLPVRFTFNNNYFNDIYQGIPVGGYNKLIDGLLEGVECRCDTDFFKKRSFFENIADVIVFTGAIDEYYQYRFGKLEYRSLLFEEEELDCPNYQGNAVVNYTEGDIPYTRIIEHKHFEYFRNEVYKYSKTIITKEYPTEWKEGKEAYYPINNERNNLLYEQYRELALREDNIIFGGRLAEYKYYDMAPIIKKVLNIFRAKTYER